MGRRIRGQSEGVVVLDKREELRRERQERVERNRREAQQRADANHFVLDVCPMLEAHLDLHGFGYHYINNTPGHPFTAGLGIYNRLRTDLIYLYWERGHLHLRIRDRGDHVTFPDLTAATIAKIRFYLTDITVVGPRWLDEFKLAAGEPYDIRIFWKELRLAGYRVIPGYSVIELPEMPGLANRYLGGPSYLTVKYIDTGISQGWHARYTRLGGYVDKHYYFETLDGVWDHVIGAGG